MAESVLRLIITSAFRTVPTLSSDFESDSSSVKNFTGITPGHILFVPIQCQVY